MNVRPIDANALREELTTLNVILGGKLIFHPEARKSVLEAIEMRETLDYAPVVHGEWIRQDDTYTKFQCGECKSKNFDRRWVFCPLCGAKMDGEKENG